MNINQAAQAIGVSAVTLKRWLISGKVKDVERDRNNWRVFTPADIERIKQYASKDSDSSTSAVSGKNATPLDRSIYSAASFFTGIGGFDIGFESAGFSISMQCEVEPFCQSLLRKHWPNVPLHPDITKLQNDNIPKSDVWVGGFPCQDLSLARMGKRDGLRGSKSGLFYEFARLVGEGKPELFFSKTLRAYSAPTEEKILESCSQRWPSSGILSDGVLLTANTSECPNHGRGSTLSDVVETGEVQEKYFLSPNAAKGIIRRADRMGRNLRPHFRMSLEILAAKAP